MINWDFRVATLIERETQLGKSVDFSTDELFNNRLYLLMKGEQRLDLKYYLVIYKGIRRDATGNFLSREIVFESMPFGSWSDLNEWAHANFIISDRGRYDIIVNHT